ncbi:MAG: DNA polymerase III subunit epsilon [Pseudomonadota bacterium]
MREIVLDTETTGLDPHQGDRIVEIGAVELFNHVPTGQTFHKYINPQRAMSPEAFEVHGLGDEFLADKPVFPDIADEFLGFIGQARLVIHNASFDMKFINAELKWADRTRIPDDRAIDTLDIARRRFPGSPASLDALCRRFGIDNSARTLHGALLDSEILAEVYLELIGGRQPDFGLSGSVSSDRDSQIGQEDDGQIPARPRALPDRLTDEERKAHAAFVRELGSDALWLRKT